ncbi:MAG: hypothetical protein KF833_00760 [Verrucomicrobiae bacterium]|nr:hypothetical protein [Verrucomicrobiae bacterium]
MTSAAKVMSPPTPPVEPPAGAACADAGDGDEGAAQALRRLEAGERQAHNAFLRAVESGDPRAIASSRRGWLAVCEALRKADLAVSEVRRGDTVSSVAAVGAFIAALAPLRQHAAALLSRIGPGCCSQARDASASAEIEAVIQGECDALEVSIEHAIELFSGNLGQQAGEVGKRVLDQSLTAGRTLQSLLGRMFGELDETASRRPIARHELKSARERLFLEFSKRLGGLGEGKP